MTGMNFIFQVIFGIVSSTDDAMIDSSNDAMVGSTDIEMYCGDSSEDDTILSREIFNLAVKAVELTNTKDRWEYKEDEIKMDGIPYNDDKNSLKNTHLNIPLLNDMKMINLRIFKSSCSETDKDSYSSWNLGDDEREVRGREAADIYISQLRLIKRWVIEYKNKKALNTNPVIGSTNKEMIESLCSELIQLCKREFGLFLQYCFSLVHEYDFENILRNFIIKNTDPNNLSTAVNDTLFDIDDCKMAIGNLNTTDGGFYISLNGALITLHIFNLNMRDTKVVLEYLCNTLGSNFPIHKIEFIRMSLAGCEYPLAEIKGDILKYTTRIKFKDCSLTN